jgi:hypothetical protein
MMSIPMFKGSMRYITRCYEKWKVVATLPDGTKKTRICRSLDEAVKVRDHVLSTGLLPPRKPFSKPFKRLTNPRPSATGEKFIRLKDDVYVVNVYVGSGKLTYVGSRLTLPEAVVIRDHYLATGEKASRLRRSLATKIARIDALAAEASKRRAEKQRLRDEKKQRREERRQQRDQEQTARRLRGAAVRMSMPAYLSAFLDKLHMVADHHDFEAEPIACVDAWADTKNEEVLSFSAANYVRHQCR